MNLKKDYQINLKRLIPVGALATVTAIIAVAASCNENDDTSSNAHVVAINAEQLKEVKVTGNAFSLRFEVPKSITHVDSQGRFDENGALQALSVYGRTNLMLNAREELNNRTFMPLELLQAYVSDRLRYEQGKLVYDEGVEVVDVLAKYGALFGFTLNNVNAVRTLGIYRPELFDLQFQLNTGFSTSSASELARVVAINASLLKPYLDLEADLINDASTLAALQDGFKFTPNSTERNVVWEEPLLISTLPPRWAPYLKGFYFTSTIGGPPLNSQPTSFAYEPSERVLFIRFEAKENVSLAFSSIDISDYVNLRSIPTDLQQSLVYQSLTPNTWSPFVQANRLLLNTKGQTLPVGLAIEYALNSTGALTWMSASAFNTHIKEAVARGDTSFKARLVGSTINNAVYVLDPAPVFSYDFPESLDIVDVTSLYADLAKQEIDINASTANNIVWTNVVTDLSKYNLPNALSISYLYGSSLTADEAVIATEWTNALPSLPKTNLAFQTLWARVNVRPGFLVDPLVFDLTDSSKIATFVNGLSFTNVDVSSLSNEANLIKASSNSFHSNVSWNNALTIPARFSDSISSIEYLAGDYSTLAAAQLAPEAAWSKNLPTQVDEIVTRRNLYVRFSPKPSFKLTGALVNITVSSGIRGILVLVDETTSYRNFNINVARPIVTNNLLTLSSGFALPAHTRLEWKLANGEWTSYANLLVALKSITSLAQLEGLSVRLRVTDDSKYLLLKDQMQAVSLAAIGGFVLDSAIVTNFDRLKATAIDSDGHIRWNLDPALLPGVVNYQYLTGDFPDLASTVNANWLESLPTQLQAKTAGRDFWVRAFLANNYVFATGGIVKLLKTGIEAIEGSTMANTADLNSAVLGVQVDSNSSNNNVVFNREFAIPKSLSWAVSRIEFLSGFFPTWEEAQVATSWTTSAPKVVDFDQDKRFLWVRYFAFPTIVLSRSYMDLTISSNIKTVRSEVDSTVEYRNLMINKFKLLGTYAEPTYDDQDVTLPVGTHLEFSYQYSPPGSTSPITMRNLTLMAFLNSVKENFEKHIDSKSFTIRLVLNYDVNTQRKYVLLKPIASVPITDYFFEKAAFDPTVDKGKFTRTIVEQLKSLVVYDRLGSAETSTHNDVKWDFFKYLVEVPNEIEDFAFALTTTNGPPPLVSASWGDLPTQVDFDLQARFLWVKFIPRTGIRLSNAIVAFTEPSRIQLIPSLLAVWPGFDTLSLANIRLSGNLEAFSLSEEYDIALAKLPPGVLLRFEFDQNGIVSTRLTKEAFYEFITNLPTMEDYQAVLQTLRIRVGLRDETIDGRRRIIITDSDYKRTPIDISNFSF